MHMTQKSLCFPGKSKINFPSQFALFQIEWQSPIGNKAICVMLVGLLKMGCINRIHCSPLGVYL